MNEYSDTIQIMKMSGNRLLKFQFTINRLLI